MFAYDSLLPFGKVQEGALEIRDSFSLTAEKRGGEPCNIIYMLSRFVGEEPRIRFEITVSGQKVPLYVSHSYRVGASGNFVRNEWRIPPILCEKATVSVCIEIPKGTVLSIRDFGSDKDRDTKASYGIMRHNAHLGFWGLAPDNTMAAFELAVASGFTSCIVVPKETLDGVLVCIHDDTINRTARDKNGARPEEEIFVWDKTYEELSQWEYGSWKNEIYKGASLPKLSDFFDLCKRTGMKPMFSTHPGLSVQKWKEVREMLSERGLLKDFHIKSFDLEVLKTAFSIFGTDIDGYTYDISKWDFSVVEKLLESPVKGCRIGIEVRASACNEEIAKAIKSAGFFASVWNVERRDVSEYERWSSFGVTEVTEDFHCSMGLNF